MPGTRKVEIRKETRLFDDFFSQPRPPTSQKISLRKPRFGVRFLSLKRPQAGGYADRRRGLAPRFKVCVEWALLGHCQAAAIAPMLGGVRPGMK
jgi:hypothetical protein